MYIVAQTADGLPADAEIVIDGALIKPEQSGADVVGGKLTINGSRLYHFFKAPTAEAHRIDIKFAKPKVRVFTFTFG